MSRRHPLRTASLALGLVAISSSLVACGDAEADDEAAGGSGLTVVATTDVWGDVVSTVAGSDVEVRSVISDPSQDPHSFEADTDTLLAVSKADLIVENGGGYDDFMGTMVDSSDTRAVVVNAVEVSGQVATPGEELNEHVWYDLPSVQQVAQQVAATLGELDPEHAADFQDNADEFAARLDDLIAQETTAASADTGLRIGITQPVPLYLTEAMGLTNATPEKFSEAIEQGDDVSVAVLKETLDLYADGAVDALVYNEQTSGPITEQVRTAAQDAGIPVVPVTETLPEGADYVSWMQSNIDALRTAIAAGAQR
ncbi:MAG: zinc ABC transporter substrate-binding protein [Rhodoferax sp.]|nr:zinc ABC transporter substrate-binding protein [Actinomycetota bacterium]